MKRLFLIAIVMLLLPACTDQVAGYQEVQEAYHQPQAACAILSWQDVFYDVLNRSGWYRFMLYDMDLDGIPELFVIDSQTDEVTVYTVIDSMAVPLAHGDGISLDHLLRGAARTTIHPAPEGVTGFVFAWTGPSAGRFGTSRFFRRVVMENGALVIADYGEIYIDIATLHEHFDGFGFDADDDVLYAAIEENTHIRINGNPVTEAELLSFFGSNIMPFELHEVNADNINDIIFG